MNTSINTSSMDMDSNDTLIMPNQFNTLFTIIGITSIGFLGILGSVFVVAVIFSNKTMRTSCFELIGGAAIGSILVATYYFLRGLDKILLLYDISSIRRVSWRCLLLTGLFGLWGIPFHSLTTLCVSFDRLMSLLIPIQYRKFDRRYVPCLLCGCALFVTGQEIVAFATAPLQEMVVCREFPDAVTPSFISTFGILNLLYFSINVVAYGAIMASFLYKKHMSHHNEMEIDLLHQQQSAILPTVKLMMVLYLISGVGGEACINVTLHMDFNQTSFFLLGLGSILKAASSLVELVSLAVRSSKFRSCARSMVGMKEEVVSFVTP